jgi:hypothetical protein
MDKGDDYDKTNIYKRKEIMIRWTRNEKEISEKEGKQIKIRKEYLKGRDECLSPIKFDGQCKHPPPPPTKTKIVSGNAGQTFLHGNATTIE